MKQLIIFLFLLPISIFAQNYPLQKDFDFLITKQIATTNRNLHTAFKPFDKSYCFIDSVLYQQDRKPQTAWFWRKFRNENFMELQTPDFQLSINPLLNLELGKDKTGFIKKPLTVNTRGIEVKGRIGKTFSFYTSFYENQAFYTDYIKQQIDSQQVAMGQGAVKNYQLTGYDFSRAEGYLSYTPQFEKFYLNFQFGQGKHFIGEGYRSLLLSDNSLGYPFLKIAAQYADFQLTTLFTELQTFYDVYYNYHYRRRASINYLSWNANQYLQIGWFESLVLKNSINSTNILTGFNGKLLITTNLQLYSQGILDENQKMGFQAGAKFLGTNSPNSWLHHLFLQTELNYSQQELCESYTNQNQALTHPLGSGFKEVLGILNYRYKDCSLGLKFTYAQNADNETIMHQNIRLAYLLNPRTNLQLFTSYDIRTYKTEKSPYFSVGICTNINNYYFDF